MENELLEQQNKLLQDLLNSSIRIEAIGRCSLSLNAEILSHLNNISVDGILSRTNEAIEDYENKIKTNRT